MDTDNPKIILIMKRLIMINLFCSLLGLFGCQAQSSKYKTVGVDEFATIIADTTVVRLDVRTANEYAEGHIDGAINIDVLGADFESKALQTLPKEKTIALYCRSGNRSKRAAKILADKGYQVVELSTGYMGWKK